MVGSLENASVGQSRQNKSTLSSWTVLCLGAVIHTQTMTCQQIPMDFLEERDKSESILLQFLWNEFHVNKRGFNCMGSCSRQWDPGPFNAFFFSVRVYLSCLVKEMWIYLHYIFLLHKLLIMLYDLGVASEERECILIWYLVFSQALKKLLIYKSKIYLIWCLRCNTPLLFNLSLCLIIPLRWELIQSRREKHLVFLTRKSSRRKW